MEMDASDDDGRIRTGIIYTYIELKANTSLLLLYKIISSSIKLFIFGMCILIYTGTVWTATAHAITAIVGSALLGLPWSVAQLGWIAGPFFLIFFASVAYYIAILQCDCYRSPDPVKGRRNYTYMAAVKAILGTTYVIN